MLNNIMRITGIVTVLFVMTCLNSFAQNSAHVKIEFEKNSKRIDIVTDRELPDYKFAQRGSFQFFLWRLDEPEDVIHYFHDGARTVPFKNLRSMEKFQKKYAMWRLRYFTGMSDSPQYIPRIHTLAVSFVPLSTSTKEKERRVYVLLDDLKLIDRGEKK